ncbi:Cof-type HAD-IIB family hydrolase [Intestinibacillus sp. Marseille-P6563]|uniref:Cof-type HAD-IIB family hydrolase n=1 Tax=Intestinibacillus sp. Marseille-P6563 TaxID=2364792 RepID=UPI000F0571DE|nr:Cof-type HAD-IIB family hydrolase [Intestinibacillus sp. Marseille-P6563]
MQYNLIALDLDGTALDPTNQVAPATVAAIAKARQRGMRVVISTGRICGEASEFARQMGADDYMVTSGGAAVSMWGEERCLMRLSMPWEASVRAAAALERVGLSTMVYVGERILITPYDEMMFGKYKSNEGYLAIKKVVPSVAEWVAQNRVMVDKIFSRSADPATIARVRQVLSQIEGIRVMSSASDNVEIVSPAADKGTALGLLCRLYGTDLSRCAAVGDSENDLEMLSAVGMPIAMGNARDDVKALCRHVTSDNAHDGVAQAIEWLLEQ